MDDLQRSRILELLAMVRKDLFLSDYTGLRAAPFEGGGRTVYDEAAQNRAHAKLHANRHRRGLEKWERLRRAFESLPSTEQRNLRLVLDSGYHGMGGDLLTRYAFDLAKFDLNVAALAAYTKSVQRYAKLARLDPAAVLFRMVRAHQLSDIKRAKGEATTLLLRAGEQLLAALGRTPQRRAHTQHVAEAQDRTQAIMGTLPLEVVR